MAGSPLPTLARREPHATPAGRAARAAVDLVVLSAALALALTPLLPVYGHATAVPALVGGLLVGGGIAAVGARRGWSALGVVAALVVGYLLVGGALAAPSTTVARVLPGPATPVALARGAASSWKQVLTLQPPTGSGGTVLVAALLLALAGAAAAVSIALRSRSPRAAACAALVPLAVAVGAALLGTSTPPVPPAVTGTALAVLLGGWASWRAGRLGLRRALATAVVAAVAVGAGLAGGPAVAAGTPRFVLRDEMTPPFDPADYPSPLAAFRKYVKLDDTVLFTVTGLPAGARIRLATFDRYDGVVWNVAGGGTAQGSGEFRRVGDELPAPVDGTPATVTVDVGALTGPWLPTVGEAIRIRVADADAAAGLRYDDATGAAVLTGGLRDGLHYTLDVVVPPVPSVTALGAAPASDATLPADTGVPARIDTLAPQVARDAGNPAEVVEALATWLTDNGYFSHGQSGEHPSLSGHGADRLASFLGGDVVVGDGEQYAAALALMVREMGLPARVVLGFVPGSGSPAASGSSSGSASDEAASDEAHTAAAGTGTGAVGAGTDVPVDVTGADVQAWVEVPFPGYGWVPFDATPPQSKTVDQDPDPAPSDPKPQVVQPPPPADEQVSPPDEDTAQPSTRQGDGASSGTPTWQRVLVVAGAGLGGLVVLAGPFLLVVGLKLARRRRRRRAPDPVHAVAGGWDEAMDAARDLRRPPLPRGTRREAARAVAAGFSAPDADGAAGAAAIARPVDGAIAAAVAGAGAGERGALVGVRLDGLARRADRAVFAPGVPDDAEVAAYWADVDAALAQMRAAVPRRARWRAHTSAASLRRRPTACRASWAADHATPSRGA